MRKLLLGAATLVTTIGLGAGVAAAQTGGGSIQDTGPDSSASIRTHVRTHTDIDNRNNLTVTNTNAQTASSGKAVVAHNTRGGDAVSGDARNSNSTNISASIRNNTSDTLQAALNNVPGSVGGGSISDTGPDSSARISTRVSTSTRVNNYNDLTVTNTSSQSAFSGDAIVAHNTHGGDAVSGDASNTNSTSITLSVNN